MIDAEISAASVTIFGLNPVTCVPGRPCRSLSLPLKPHGRAGKQYGMKKKSWAAALAHAVLAFTFSPAFAQSYRTVKDPVELSKILHSIRAYQGDLGSRLSAGGMGVEFIMIHKLTNEDIAEDPLQFAPGDVELRIRTTGDPDAEGCRILGSPTLIKRGHRYIPQDRTGVWLLTGKCALPD